MLAAQQRVQPLICLGWWAFAFHNEIKEEGPDTPQVPIAFLNRAKLKLTNRIYPLEQAETALEHQRLRRLWGIKPLHTFAGVEKGEYHAGSDGRDSRTNISSLFKLVKMRELLGIFGGASDELSPAQWDSDFGFESGYSDDLKSHPAFPKHCW